MADTKIKITFDHFTVKKITVSRIIKESIRASLKAENVLAHCEINVLVTTDKGIHAINLASRNVDRPTDVLSFPMFELTAGQPPEDWEDYLDPGTDLVPLGDMCISLERAQAQATEFGHSLRRELGYLTVHSVLHLLGYDHMDEGEQKRRMRAREDAIIQTMSNMTRD